jgi:hypothetical protein
VALAMAMRCALTYAAPPEDYAMGRLITL